MKLAFPERTLTTETAAAVSPFARAREKLDLFHRETKRAWCSALDLMTQVFDAELVTTEVSFKQSTGQRVATPETTLSFALRENGEAGLELSTRPMENFVGRPALKKAVFCLYCPGNNMTLVMEPDLAFFIDGKANGGQEEPVGEVDPSDLAVITNRLRSYPVAMAVVK